MILLIEDCGNHFDVVEHTTYEISSVLAGQFCRQIHGMFDTLQEAQDAFPYAKLADERTTSVGVVPDLPPEGWDPEDCGETW